MIGRFSAISCITDTSKPFNKAQRWRKLSQKSISPRMAASVIAFTWSPTPARIANSSITSVSIKVESISKQIRRRIRRYMLSSWKEISISSSVESFMNSAFMHSLFFGVPRTENSTLALGVRAFSSNGIRPVSRLISSIFISCSATIRETPAICLAVSLRLNIVMIYRFLPCIPTHLLYSCSVMGLKRILTSNS